MAAPHDRAPQPDDVSPGLPDSAFRALVDHISLPIMVMDADGRITYAGGSSGHVFGLSGDDAVGRNVVEFLPPDQVEVALRTIGDLLRADEIGIGVPTPYAIMRDDGGVTWQAIGAVPMLDHPDVEGIVLYHLPWDAQLHFDAFLSALLAGAPLEAVLTDLGRSLAFSFEARGTVVHHGFDGRDFTGATGAGVDLGWLHGDDAPWHMAARSGQPWYGSADAVPGGDGLADAGVRGVWAIPVPMPEGMPGAVLSVWRSVDALPVTAHHPIITRSLQYAQLALVTWTEHQQLAHMATHDGLTGAANRTLFRRHLADELATGRVAVAFCDLDGFKAINDTFGHGTGDEVLVAVADRLRGALRPGDELARIGGDEFTVLLRDLDGAEARAAGERLVAAVERPVVVDGVSLSVGLSVGVAMPAPGSSADSMLSRADAALYRAKRDGGRRVRMAD